MIALRRCLLVAAVVLVPLATSAGAEDWSPNRLDPRAKQPRASASSRSQSAPAAFSPAALLTPIYKLHEENKRMLYAGGKKLQAGTIQLHNNTKKFFVTTASYLSPSHLFPRKPAPSRSGRSPWIVKRKKKSSHWLIPSWLKPEEPRNSTTMRGFLSQKRPEFYSD